ncbi:MAG: PKD domain-containing protein [Rikenellaceae bacterium]
MKSYLFGGILLIVMLVSCNKNDESELEQEQEQELEQEQEATSSAYITKVIDFMPAVGQYVNKFPLYEDGDNQDSMNNKVLASIGNNNGGLISLGGFGGYVVVGFDHTIENIEGEVDFCITSNAYYSVVDDEYGSNVGGSCEPGVIMVAYDANNNGLPDDDEWYEIAGSELTESWIEKARDNGNDVALIYNYQISYYRPTSEDETEEYIRWEDSEGDAGYIVKNIYHTQSYYPQWTTQDKLTFTGTRLPQNGIDESGTGSNYVLYKFDWGYADNDYDSEIGSSIDIGWAVDQNREKVSLPGVDFIKIYTAVNQVNGFIGECSTEIKGIEDLHLLD